MSFISGLASLVLATSSIPALIGWYSDRFDFDKQVALNVAKSESNYNINALGDGGRALGIFQFHKETFFWMAEEYKKQYGLKIRPDYNNAEDQIKVAIWAMSKSNDYACHWTTWRRQNDKDNAICGQYGWKKLP
jgi:soluble lytic murein transglycosylase-like protein